MIFSSDYTVPKMIQDSSKKYGEFPAQQVRHKDGTFSPVSYSEMFQNALDFSGALLKLNVQRQQPVGLIADNRKEWLDASIGIMAMGAFDVPRGCDATPDDLEKILSITECKIVVTENATQVKKLLNIKDKLPWLETIITFTNDLKPELLETLRKRHLNYYHFEEIQKEGKQWRLENPGKVEEEVAKGNGDELATIIFTSGTTGNPKGVMLTHTNFLIQLDEAVERIYMLPGQGCLSVLPVWHVFEREMEYIVLVQGGAICYSKPVISIILADLQTINPSIFPTVPRVFEALKDAIIKKLRKSDKFTNEIFDFFMTVAIWHKRMERKMFVQNPCLKIYKRPMWWFLYLIPWVLMWPLYGAGYVLLYKKIRAYFGKNYVSGVTGGGAFPEKLDEFYWASGVKLIEAYGLTETAPMVAMRPIRWPVYRTIGRALRHVQVRIVDPNDGFVLGRGKQGVLQVKGPTVMKGYYKRPDLTAKVMTADGWFDTGDLAVMTMRNNIQIKGRIKDTIVLSNGENLEPVPIEAKLSESRFISRAVVVGQDKRYLGALILVNMEELQTYAEEYGFMYDETEGLVSSDQVKQLYEDEINGLISTKNGFKVFEQINKFCLLTKPFEIGVELSAKQEVMRFRISQIYKEQIDEMFDEN